MKKLLPIFGLVLIGCFNQEKDNFNIDSLNLNLKSCNNYGNLDSLISLIDQSSINFSNFYNERYDEATTKEISYLCFDLMSECGVGLYYGIKKLQKTEPELYSKISEHYPLKYGDEFSNNIMSSNPSQVYLKLQLLKLLIIDYCNCN